MAINERTRKEEEDVEKILKKKIFFQNLVKTIDTDPRSSKEETLQKYTKAYQNQIAQNP